MKPRLLARAERRASLPREAGLPRERGAGNGAVAIAAASLVSLCLLASATEEPLPALGWAAAFLFITVERDVRERRIPNWLTLPALCLFVIHAAWSGGLTGAVASLLGAGLALGVLVVPYAAGWFGAGDVKAVMALGALWGGAVVLAVLAWAIVSGGLLALAWIALRGGLVDLIQRWWRTLHASLALCRWTYFAPPPGSAAAGGIPFGVAIGLGVAAFQQWGTPWA